MIVYLVDMTCLVLKMDLDDHAHTKFILHILDGGRQGETHNLLVCFVFGFVLLLMLF